MTRRRRRCRGRLVAVVVAVLVAVSTAPAALILSGSLEDPSSSVRSRNPAGSGVDAWCDAVTVVTSPGEGGDVADLVAELARAGARGGGVSSLPPEGRVRALATTLLRTNGEPPEIRVSYDIVQRGVERALAGLAPTDVDALVTAATDVDAAIGRHC